MLDSRIDLTDARGKKRRLRVAEVHAQGAVAECQQTYYLTPEVAPHCKGAKGHKTFTAYPGAIATLPGGIRLHRGDTLQLTLHGAEGAASDDNDPLHLAAGTALIACTTPLVFGQVHAGERVWFDDGRIGGVVRKTTQKTMDIDIVQARDTGENLAADTGINFPDSQLDLPALTEKDLVDLQTVAEVADLVGLSFVQDPAEIQRLLQALHQTKKSPMLLALRAWGDST